MKKLLLLFALAVIARADTPVITGCGVFDLGSRAVSMQWVTDEPGSLTKSRIDYDFLSSITSGTVPTTLDYRVHARGTSETSASATQRGARVHKLYPGVKVYVNCMSRDATSNWSDSFLCLRTCTNCGPSGTDANYFRTDSQLNCDAIGQPPYFTTPADSSTAPVAPEPPIHEGDTTPPAITGDSNTIAAGCTNFQLLVNQSADAANNGAGSVEEILIPPDEVCRPEQESSAAGSNLDQYSFPDALPGRVVIRSSADPELCPSENIRTDPSFYSACTAKFEYNKNDLRDLKNHVFHFSSGSDVGGYYFENPSISPPPLDEISKLSMTVTAVNTTTDVITVNSTTGLENGDIVVVNLAGEGVLGGDGPARACHISGNTLKLERVRSNFCNQTDVNLVGTYDGSGGTIARWIAQPVAAWQNTTPLRATVTGHGMGNYPEDPITGGTTNTLTVSGATGTGYQIAAGNAVWISGTDGPNSATCNGLRLVSSFVTTTITLSTAGTNCASVTTGNVRRIIGLSTFNTSDADLGIYDPKVYYFHVIDANTLEFPEIGTQGTVTTPGYITMEPPVIPDIVGRPDPTGGADGRKQDITFDRALVVFPFPWRVHTFLGIANTTRMQLVNSWVDIRLWQRLNKLNRVGCVAPTCIDGVTDAGTTGSAYVAYMFGIQDWQFRNTTVTGSSDFFLDSGGVSTPSFDVSYKWITQFRPDTRASYHANSDGHLYRETYCIEMKTGYRISFYGNYHRGCRVDFSKNGATIEFSDVASATTTMFRVADVDMQYITIADSAGGIYLPSADGHQEGLMGVKQRFRFNHILLANLDYQTYKDPQWLGDGAGGFGFGFLGGITHVNLSNVTYFSKRARQPFPIYFGEQGGSAVQIQNNLFGITEGDNTGFQFTNDAASGGNAVPAADFSGGQDSFESIFLKGPTADPDSLFTGNFYLPLIESSSGSNFSGKFVDTDTASTLCRHEAAALALMDWDDVGTNVVGTTDNPCLESASTRTTAVFGATGWEPTGSYVGKGASPAAMNDPQGWVSNIAITENSSTSVTISWRAPNTLGCTVDLTHTTLDFSNAANITRQTDAGGTQDQSETFTGLSELTAYRARIGCQNAEPFVWARPFTTGGVP